MVLFTMQNIPEKKNKSLKKDCIALNINFYTKHDEGWEEE